MAKKPTTDDNSPAARIALDLERSELQLRESSPLVVTITAANPVSLLVRVAVYRDGRRVASVLPWTARELSPSGPEGRSTELQMHLVCRPPAPGRQDEKGRLLPESYTVVAAIASADGKPIDSAEATVTVRPAKED